ncbi:MAG: DUF3124 domain-containing protein [Geobacteraceae bacterium]|nr:DUF3124 domain-containing protein [Geobacteraceae bacterium]
MWNQVRITGAFLSTALWLAVAMLPTQGWSSTADIRLSQKQTVYVPVYSNIISGPRKRPLPLEATLAIRSTDPAASLRITAIDYYDTDGRLVRRHLKRPQLLGPLASTDVHIEERDMSGGFGANFIVRWEADRIINAPVIECVMIGASGGQGISFVSPGQEIREGTP